MHSWTRPGRSLVCHCAVCSYKGDAGAQQEPHSRTLQREGNFKPYPEQCTRDSATKGMGRLRSLPLWQLNSDGRSGWTLSSSGRRQHQVLRGPATDGPHKPALMTACSQVIVKGETTGQERGLRSPCVLSEASQEPRQDPRPYL